MDIYEQAISDKYASNIIQLRENILINDISVDQYLKTTLQSMENTSGIKWNDNDIEYIKNGILTNDFIAMKFIKNPIKQNTFEHVFLTYLQSIPYIENVKKLPASSLNSLYLYNGYNITKQEKDNIKSSQDDNVSKSIDFYFTLNDFEFFISHKYTKGQGGAQDNQYMDQLGYFKNSLLNHDKNKIFIAVCDGDFYHKKDKKGMTKKDKILEYKDNNLSNSFVLSYDELEDFLYSFLDKSA